MERNEWSICSWLSSLTVSMFTLIVAKSPRRIPSFRKVGSRGTFGSVASLLKPATSVSFSSIVTRSENIARPTVSSDKYRKCLSRINLAALRWINFFKFSNINPKLQICSWSLCSKWSSNPCLGVQKSQKHNKSMKSAFFCLGEVKYMSLFSEENDFHGV